MTSDAFIEDYSGYDTNQENNRTGKKSNTLHILTEGMNNEEILDLKIKLNWLGYGKSKITPKFGAYFKEQVMKFQSDYQLPVTGVFDYTTREKVDSVLLQLNRFDNEEDRLKMLATTLKKFGFDQTFDSSYPDEQQIEVSIRSFQKHYQLDTTGELNPETFEKMKALQLSPYQLGEKNEKIIKLKKQLNALGYGRLKVTSKFGAFMEKKLKKFQHDYGLPVSGIADEITLNKLNMAHKVKERVTYSNYEVSLKEAVKYKQQETAREDLASLLDPNNYINDDKKKFYFVDLFRSTVVTSSSTLNKLLKDDHRLNGKGQVILEAANSWNINELFLISHAMYDVCPGTALEEGQEITEWVKLVKSQYNPNHNTLYKIYCNPDAIIEGQKQPNTDGEWITNQMERMYRLYQELESYTLYLEIPVYKDRPVEKYIRG